MNDYVEAVQAGLHVYQRTGVVTDDRGNKVPAYQLYLDAWEVDREAMLTNQPITQALLRWKAMKDSGIITHAEKMHEVEISQSEAYRIERVRMCFDDTLHWECDRA